MDNIKALQAHKLWFSRHEDFNDPYEGKLAPPSQTIRNMVDVMGEKIDNDLMISLEAEYLSTFNPYLDRQRICCFSRKKDDICLWAHYADNHRGFCLEFNVLDDVDFFMPILPVVYKREFAPADLWKEPNTILEQIYQRKSDAWASEDEVRVIKKGRAGLRSYAPSALKSIIFGCRASDEDISMIRAITPPNTRFRRAEMSTTSYELRIVDI